MVPTGDAYQTQLGRVAMRQSTQGRQSATKIAERQTNIPAFLPGPLVAGPAQWKSCIACASRYRVGESMQSLPHTKCRKLKAEQQIEIPRCGPLQSTRLQLDARDTPSTTLRQRRRERRVSRCSKASQECDVSRMPYSVWRGAGRSRGRESKTKELREGVQPRLWIRRSAGFRINTESRNLR